MKRILLNYLLLAFKKLEAGDATVKDYNTLITQFMLGKKLAKHFERSAEVREFIDEAWHELNKCRYGGIKEDQLNTIHECVVMCGTMIEKCEKFRVMQALEEIRK